jgi:putative transposase
MMPLQGMWLALRWLLGYFLILRMNLWRRLRPALPPAYTGSRMHAVRRLATGWGGWGASVGSNGQMSHHPQAKPDWVKAVVLQLAHDLPNAGCRSLAHSFNLAHSASNQTVSKTWVANLLQAHAAALALARHRSQRQGCFAGLGEPIQRVWGIDLTGLPLTSGESMDVWGIVDHGSRTVLQLEPVARFSSLILLGRLLVAFGEYGLPKAVRSDNASVFRAALFRATLKFLGVRQQFTQLHCPWQNGRIERFWRTLKETLGTKPIRFRQGARILQEQMRFASFAAMPLMLSEFRDFYNHNRPHQALSGRTPAMVWSQQLAKQRENWREKQAQVKAKTARNKAVRQVARAPP